MSYQNRLPDFLRRRIFKAVGVHPSVQIPDKSEMLVRERLTKITLQCTPLEPTRPSVLLENPLWECGQCSKQAPQTEARGHLLSDPIYSLLFPETSKVPTEFGKQSLIKRGVPKILAFSIKAPNTPMGNVKLRVKFFQEWIKKKTKFVICMRCAHNSYKKLFVFWFLPLIAHWGARGKSYRVFLKSGLSRLCCYCLLWSFE